MQKLITSKLIRFDRKKLSFYKLIYSHYKPKWVFIISISIIIGFTFMGYFMIPVNPHHWWSLLISIPILTFTVIYTKRRTLIIIKSRYNARFKLNITKKWSYDTIQIIRLKLFKKYIKGIKTRDKKSLSIVIDYLNFERASNKYNYTLSTTSVVLILGALLGAYLSRLFDLVKTINEFYQINKIILGTVFLLVIMILYFERFIVREIVLWYRNRNKRLIQTIYNYLIEK